MTAKILYFTDTGKQTAARIASVLSVCGFTVFSSRCIRHGLEDWSKEAFDSAELLVYVGACGIAVRGIGKLIRHKTTDPAVLCVDETAAFVIPLLSGHLGGANEYARKLAKQLGAVAVITTATDLQNAFAVDTWAKSQGLLIQNPDQIRRVSAKILKGIAVDLYSDWPIEGTAPALVHVVSSMNGADVSISYQKPMDNKTLWCVPKGLVLGIGCKKNISSTHLETVIHETLKQQSLPLEAIAIVATIDRKAKEPAILDFIERHRLPLRTFSAEELQAQQGDFKSSAFVKQTVGCDNVCERSAVCASKGGELLLSKVAKEGVTIAVAKQPVRIRWEKEEL